MKGNVQMEKSMEKEKKNIIMVYLKVNLKMVSVKDMGYFITKMVKNMKVNSKKSFLTDMEFIIIQIVIYMKLNLKMNFQMD